jgi:hypothetical protein
MAVAEFQGQFMNASDLKVFFQKYVPSSPVSDAEVYKFHGGVGCSLLCASISPWVSRVYEESCGD